VVTKVERRAAGHGQRIVNFAVKKLLSNFDLIGE
jgi:hypothetical protein